MDGERVQKTTLDEEFLTIRDGRILPSFLLTWVSVLLNAAAWIVWIMTRDILRRTVAGLLGLSKQTTGGIRRFIRKTAKRYQWPNGLENAVSHT
jgi:hypothetical protein